MNPIRKCGVCGHTGIIDEEVFVACIPGVPYSAAYCRKCVLANAHPWGILVANTACCGGWKKCNDEWKQIVLDTCNHLNRTLDEFLTLVDKNIEELKKTTNHDTHYERKAIE